MKIYIKRLGVLEQAEFELGDFTVICGGNNTGKTYATHATYGFFDYVRNVAEFPVTDNVIKDIYSVGSTQIDLKSYIRDLPEILNNSAKSYTKQLYKVFAGNEKLFKQSSFEIKIPNDHITTNNVNITFGSSEKKVLQVKSIDNMTLEANLIITNQDQENIPPEHIVKDMLEGAVREAITGRLFPKPFLASAERTGAAIFQKELDFTRNSLLGLIGDKETKITPLKLLGKFSGEYPIAIRRNVDFIRNIPNITNKESFITKEHPNLLKAFGDIIGGEYVVSKDGEINYIPIGKKHTKLSLVESSSAVRSLLDVGFYLRHIAQPGDLLMVDEPELNLHPENQRRIVRLFARLINLGIKIFITTHSDYIIKELNTLIMLNHDKPYLKKIAKHERYDQSELILAEQIKVYIAKNDLIKKDGNTKKTRCLTLILANIDSQLGIEAESFDITIDEMNRIQEAIVWGDDENE